MEYPKKDGEYDYLLRMPIYNLTKEKIDEFNHDYMEKPLSSAQVQKTITQHEKKDYQFVENVEGK